MQSKILTSKMLTKASYKKKCRLMTEIIKGNLKYKDQGRKNK